MRFDTKEKCPTREQLDNMQIGSAHLSGNNFELPTEFRRPIQGEYFITCDKNAFLAFCDSREWWGPRWILTLKKEKIYPCIKRHITVDKQVWVVLFTKPENGVMLYNSKLNDGFLVISYISTNWGEWAFTLLPENEKVILSN